METDDRVASWQRKWQERRLRCREELARLTAPLTPDALAIVREAGALAAIEDPAVHAAADTAALRDRTNALAIDEAVLLHRPVANGMSQLRIAAQELLAARAGASALVPPALRRPPASRPPSFARFVVVSDDPELGALVSESEPARRTGTQVELADTLESALASLSTIREGSALVVVNLTLRSRAGLESHGLDVAAEARRHHHAVLLVTAAGDYHHYWGRLREIGLTGHDVVIKTRQDFAGRLRTRIAELAAPPLTKVSYDDDTGHMVWIGDVEVSNLEAQEALVLRALDARWRAPESISDRCSHTDLAPEPGNVPPLISTLRKKLREALMQTDSAFASRDVIQSRRREDGLPTEYRLASWLEWHDPPDPLGAPPALPPVVVVEDDPDWADWAVTSLTELGWPARAAGTAVEALAALDGADAAIPVIDLCLPDPLTGAEHTSVGIGLINDLAGRHQGMPSIVLTAFGSRDSVRAQLFEAGVRTIDVIDKAAGRDECRALLLASLERAADEMRRGVRRGQQLVPVHRVVRLERSCIEVDGHRIELSAREAAVFELLIAHVNQPVTAELLDDQCYPPRRSAVDNLNRVHQTFKRLRQKIDRAVGATGTGVSVLQTPHRGARTTYKLFGPVTDLVGP